MINKILFRCVTFFLFIVNICPAQRFSPNERLDYEVYYNIIKAGTATIEIVAETTIDTIPVYHVRSTTRTNKFFDRIFKVRDKLDSYIHKHKFYSLYFSKSIREGHYKKNYYSIFDYDNSIAITKKDSIPIPGPVQDALSIFYYLRTDSLYVGKVIRFDNFDNNKITPVDVIVSRSESVETEAGMFDCFVIEPVETGILKYEGTLMVWLARELDCVPVLIKSKATFGSMILKLKSYRLNAE